MPVTASAAALLALLQVAAGAPPAGGPPARAQTDTGPVVLLDRFYAQVLANHPVARAARLARDQAAQDVRIARGAFDPTIAATWDRKAEKGSAKYSEVDAELKLPTITGADVKVGYSRGLGPSLNPQNGTANAGLLALGVSLPLGQRIVTDERRNALAQARAALDFAEGDRLSLVNGLLLRATRDYARWFEAWRRAAIARDGVGLADFRLRAVRLRLANGEAPAIDTLEARLEVNRREGIRVQEEQALYAATLLLQAYLWDERGQPVDLADGARPANEGFATPVALERVPTWLAAAERAHPELAKVAARIRQVEAQRLFLGQQFIPFAALDVSAVSDADRTDGLTDAGGWGDNYKFGATFRSPVLYLRERGRFSQVTQRLDQQRQIEAQLRRDVRNAVLVGANDVRAVDEQIALQAVTVQQARGMLAGEQRRFENGESSLLIVNLRERLVLDEEVRLAALQARAAVVRAELAVAIGAPARLP
ncbi:MAG: TolC family protein [Gemmatimonadetes bacterium]|nr:TolC family protein [Gemmatimonadota bacterium]